MEEPASPKAKHADKSEGWLAWRRISRWYWGAIGVIALAALARFVQAAPVTTPTTVVSATLTPGVALQITYPRIVSPVLREADRAPLALTLQGAGVITYTVALSTSAPLLFTDSRQQVVDPRAELAVNGCCQSNVVFYPQANAEVWHLQPVEVSAYAAPPGAPLPTTPTLTFTLSLEPVWWTWGRRALMLFAELGLAVSVALALGGWAIEQQRRDEEQKVERQREQKEDERRRRQREAQSQEALWRSRIERAQKVGERNLLAGVSELLVLSRTLGSNPEDVRRRTELDTVLQSYRLGAAELNSLAVEQCLEEVAARLLARQTFSEDELRAITSLFDHDATEQAKMLSRRAETTTPDELLQAARKLHHRFSYSPAIANLAVELIREWWTKIQNDGATDKAGKADKANEALEPLSHLLSDPRLACIPFTRRTHLYRLPTVTSYQYPWANPDDVAAIAQYVETMLRVDLRGFAEVPATAWEQRLPLPGFVRQPHVLKFPAHEDADCAAHLLRAHLIDAAHRGLQQKDGARFCQDVDATTDDSKGTAPSESFAPFSVAVALKIDASLPQKLPILQLTPVAHAIAEEWLALLACSPQLWDGLKSAQRSMLAGLLQMAVRTQAELQYWLRQHRHATRCQQQDAAAADGPSTSGLVHQSDDAIMEKLAASITSHWHDAQPADNVAIERLETWLTLRPDYFTHTVVVALVHPAPVRVALAEWWRSWFYLADRLRAHNVIVHLLTAQTPDAPPLHRLAEDCTAPKVQLAKLLDDVFGYNSSRFLQHDRRDDGGDGCKIEAISRLLDDNSLDLVDELSDALLTKAAGSPSRLLHMMHLILKHRIADRRGNEAEFKLSHLDIMNVVQTYPKDR